MALGFEFVACEAGRESRERVRYCQGVERRGVLGGLLSGCVGYENELGWAAAA